MFCIPKNCNKEERIKKRKSFFFNKYKKDVKIFLKTNSLSDFSVVQKSILKLSHLNSFHINKCSRLISKYNRLVKK